MEIYSALNLILFVVGTISLKPTHQGVNTQNLTFFVVGTISLTPTQRGVGDDPLELMTDGGHLREVGVSEEGEDVEDELIGKTLPDGHLAGRDARTLQQRALTTHIT